MDRVYFLCKKGGKTESAILDHISHNASVMDSWDYFSRINGGTGSVYAGDRLEGIQFDGDEPPKGWHKTKSMPEGYYKPRKGEKLKVFKGLDGKIGAVEFTKSISIEPVRSGMSIHFASYEKYDETIILSLVRSMIVPSDVKELKMSEYFKIQEDFNENPNGDVKC